MSYLTYCLLADTTYYSLWVLGVSLFNIHCSGVLS